jgi:hypothetical protein
MGAQQTRGGKASSNDDAGSSNPNRAMVGLAWNTGHRLRIARICSIVYVFKVYFNRFASNGWRFAERECPE